MFVLACGKYHFMSTKTSIYILLYDEKKKTCAYAFSMLEKVHVSEKERIRATNVALFVC